MSNWHIVRLSYCQNVKLSDFWIVGSSDCQTLRMSNCHTTIVRLSDCHYVRLSDCPTDRLSECHTVILSDSHNCRLSDCQSTKLSNNSSKPTQMEVRLDQSGSRTNPLQFSCLSVHDLQSPPLLENHHLEYSEILWLYTRDFLGCILPSSCPHLLLPPAAPADSCFPHHSLDGSRRIGRIGSPINDRH